VNQVGKQEGTQLSCQERMRTGGKALSGRRQRKRQDFWAETTARSNEPNQEGILLRHKIPSSSTTGPRDETKETGELSKDPLTLLFGLTDTSGQELRGQMEGTAGCNRAGAGGPMRKPLLLPWQGRCSGRTALPSRPDGSGDPSYGTVFLAG
jgi:hypothetical protein